MWHSRDPLPPGHGRYPPAMQASQRHTYGRRQSATYPVVPLVDTNSLHPYYQPLTPQRNVSLQAHPSFGNTQDTQYPYISPMHQHQHQQHQQHQHHQHHHHHHHHQNQNQNHQHQHHHQHQQQQRQDVFQGQGQRRQPGMTHSFSAPWNGYGGSQSKPPTPKSQQRSGVRSNGKPSMQDAVRVSAPQNLDGDFSEDDYEVCVDEDTLKRVYSYQPTPYWAGRLSSQLDRLAAEYPGETKMWRVEKAINNLNANAYGEGAKHSLDDFKEVFGKRVRNGTEW